ncbi:YdbL family protein [Fodinicurvata fenggangensis]|uniref:YdbL family protein n=1 Tax=Fodinicurvata fenggangensis TaxID=1121830 RepID=UPI0009DD1725|nr:YdbL family protein [Fodinicurvata fenggangensis]
MNMRRTLLIALLAILLGSFSLSTGAWAQSAQELRSSGEAGERWDGLMEARTPSAEQAVDDINNERLEVYRDRAEQQNAPVQEVGKVYFEKIISKVPSGTWIKKPDGKWTQIQ